MPTINLEQPTTGAFDGEARITPSIADVITTFPLTPDVDILVTLQDTVGAAETYCDVQVISEEIVYLFEVKERTDTHPLMKQILNLLVQLDPAEQRQVKEELSKLEKEVLTKEAIARQNAEWAARLDMQLARAARGENRIYYSEEEFFAALDAPPSKDRE